MMEKKYSVRQVIKCLYHNSSGHLDVSTKTLDELITKTKNIMAKVVQVCDEKSCNNRPVIDVKVGNKKHNFCCQKGFEKSLKDFANSIKSS